MNFTGCKSAITFDRQGGTGGTASVNPANYGQALPAVTIPSRNGYTFLGYFSAASGGNQYYTAAGTSARNWDWVIAAVTLYAQWSQNQTLSYNANGHGTAPAAVTMTYPNEVKAAAAITATGYTFSKWTTAQNGSGTAYAAGAVVKKANVHPAATTLYAQWTANTYAVTLDPQGGAGGAASVTATFNAAMPAAAMPTRTGYTFDGYWSGVGGTGTQFYTAAGAATTATWTTAGDGTLYASWIAKGYPLVLDNGDGTSGNVTATYDRMPPKVTVPKREGMAFRGYYTESEGAGTRVYDPNGIAGEAWTTDGGMTLYAFWQEQVAESEELAISADFREVKPAQVFKPEMLTSSPTGWEADAETAAILEAIGGGEFVTVVDPVTAPVTVWTPQEVGLYTLKHTTTGDGAETAKFNVTGFTYRVEFDTNGGTGEAMAGVDLAYGAEGTAPACAYERTDYEFDGWNTRKDGTGTDIAVGGKFSNLVKEAGVTGYLYAQWKVKTAYEFKVDVKEGESDPILEEIKLPTVWLDENLPSEVDKTKPEEVKKELEKTDPDTGLKTWHKYVLGVDKDDKSAKVWIDSPQQKEKDKIKVKMREFSPTKGTGFTVKYRLDTELNGQAKAKGKLENSPDFDIDVSKGDPTGLYTINVVFVPEGKENSDEVVESVNTMGILKVPSPKTLEIVAVPWHRLAPDGNQPVLVADLVKTATLTPGDKLHVYDKAKKNYKSWSYDLEKGWVALGTYKVSAAGLENIQAPDQTEQTVARGSAVWLERQDSSKPFYLYGQYVKDEVVTQIEKNQHNLVACPKMEPFHLNDGRITGAINANDQIIVPQGGEKPPKVYTYRSDRGGWGYTSVSKGRPVFRTDDDVVPVGTGFWYVSKGGNPTIKW